MMYDAGLRCRNRPFPLDSLSDEDREAVLVNSGCFVCGDEVAPFDEQVRRLLTDDVGQWDRLVIPPVGAVGWDLGYHDRPVFVRREVVWAALGLKPDEHNHIHRIEIGIANVCNLPHLLRYSPVVTRSRTRSDSLVATLDCKDAAGSQVVASLYEHAPSYGRVWEMTSVYGKDSYAKFLAATILEDLDVYACPVLVESWSNREGLDLVGDGGLAWGRGGISPIANLESALFDASERTLSSARARRGQGRPIAGRLGRPPV